MSAELILVRHGRTDWNDEGRYQGQEGPGLNDRGRVQAQATAQQLAGMSIEAIYSSDLARALDTARIIAQTLNVPLQTDSCLRELHQGIWQGMLFDDIQAEYGEILKRFQENPVDNSPPGGETMAQLTRRIVAALNDIATCHPDGRVVVVTHKLPIALMRCMAAGLPPSKVWNAIPENAQFVTLEWPLHSSSRETDDWLALAV